MTAVRARGLAIAAVLLSTSCAPRLKAPLSLQPATEIPAEFYDEVLERWTRSDKVYDRLLESKLFVHATFHSPEFRKAFLARFPDVYGPGSEEARRLALTGENADEYLEFFFAATTSDFKWNDFEREDSVWRITLEGDAAERVDGKTVRVKTTANVRAIYPYISDFARTYAVRFPRATSTGEPVISGRTKEFRLRIVSALGQAVLEWKLQPILDR